MIIIIIEIEKHFFLLYVRQVNSKNKTDVKSILKIAL
jgi:hypothetical protein